MLCCNLQDVRFLRKWEVDISLGLDPTIQNKRTVTYVNYQGGNLGSHFMKGCPAEEAEGRYLQGDIQTIQQLCFQDPENFVSGQIHENFGPWEHIMRENNVTDEIKYWIRQGININDYIKPFKGSFWGVDYDTDYPPPRIFSNSNKCEPFKDFITQTVLEIHRMCWTGGGRHSSTYSFTTDSQAN